MGKYILILLLFLTGKSMAQVEPGAGKWKPWFITSVNALRLSAPANTKSEIEVVIQRQQQIDTAIKRQIRFWNAGAPGYRWQEMLNKLWAVDTGRYAILANMLLGTATYDATLVAWDTKYAYKTLRPYEMDKRIKLLAPVPGSPSFPCEYSVAAGVAVTIFSKFYPHLKDSVTKMAQQLMNVRVAVGIAFPSDTRAGFELGRRIAEMEIEKTKDYVTQAIWDGKVPDRPGLWSGKYTMFPMAGLNKTVVLESANEFRPGPPPDFAKDMAEMKNYKQNFRSLSNAFYWANSSWFMDNMARILFEQNLHMNAPRAARINAALNVAAYDAFVACWDAKFTYWGIRPSQYDTTYKPAIMVTPPFPGYPSGHAAIASTTAELMSYFFPDDKALFRKKAKEAAESRFQAGIHFRTDNEVALVLGEKVGMKIVDRVRQDGADQ